MHAKPSFAHRLQTAKMASSRTSAQNNGPRAQKNGPSIHFYTCSAPTARLASCIEIYHFDTRCEPELAYRLQTSKMGRNSTSLDSCQHDDINIVTVSVARRR